MTDRRRAFLVTLPIWIVVAVLVVRLVYIIVMPR